ncbi:phosphoribosyl-AMP cyclohydrolase [bacterium]|nr:MAG: phosphoribosyl-AMP cyclohydrolase [bacterium]
MSQTNTLQLDLELSDQLKWDANGLIPGIVQSIETGEILMVAWLNKESLQKTLETGNATFWSRSRQKLWMKGESSGNTMKVQSILMDCDGDTLILLSDASGPACHTGERTCFFRALAKRESSEKNGCPGCSGCC